MKMIIHHAKHIGLASYYVQFQPLLMFRLERRQCESNNEFKGNK